MITRESLADLHGSLKNLLSMLETVDAKLSLLVAEQNELKWLIEKEVKNADCRG